MSHILQEYAKNLGAKISKPDIQQHFFPSVDKKYIVFYNGDEAESKTYKHYEMVFGLLAPFLKDNDIKVYQIGGKAPVKGVHRHLHCSFKNEAYLVSKSMLYLGPDSYLAQYASSQNVKTITLHGNNYASNTRPFWGKDEDRFCLEPEWDSKPCFSQKDPHRQIDSIMPEVVCEKILRFCGGSKSKMNFKTLHIGDSYYSNVIEVVPTSITQGLPKSLFVRIDYGVEEEPLIYYCQNHDVVLITDKLPQLNMLVNFKNNIKRIIYTVDKKEDLIPQEYLDYLKKWSIDFVMLTEKEEDLSYLRNHYFDTQVHVKDNDPEKIECSSKAKFFSNKKIIEGDKVYTSYAHFQKKLDSDNNVIDNVEYWKELKHFYIYEQEENSN